MTVTVLCGTSRRRLDPFPMSPAQDWRGVAYGAGELADRRTAREVEELEARPDVITRVMIG